MIRLLDTLKEEQRRLCLHGPAGARLLSGYQAYAGRPFALFWAQTDKTGCTTALICLLDENFTLCCSPDADGEELAAFLSALGAQRVFCEKPAGLALGLYPMETGTALRLDRLMPPSAVPCRLDAAPGEIYEILAASAGPGLSPPDKTAFHADLSHRLRHGAALAATALWEGKPAACAVACTAAATAYISGVATLPSCRGRGLGAAALSALCRALGPRDIWVLALSQTLHFYEKLGFVPSGTAGWYTPRKP